MRTRLATVLAFPIALLAFGCSKPSPTPIPPASASAASSAGTAPIIQQPLATNDNVQVGKPAPDFTAITYDNQRFVLSEFKGRQVVIYFYPKDESPGCTKEACSFRDTWDAIAKTNAVLVGISRDSDASHEKFVKHYKLPFMLISDADGAIGEKFGVPQTILGDDILEARQTFIIGADGNVKKIYREVDVTKHADQILADLKS